MKKTKLEISIPYCEKTLSHNHLWRNEVFVKEGIHEITFKKCWACGLVDDR